MLVDIELAEGTRTSIDAYLRKTGRRPWQYLFGGRGKPDAHLSTRQYARLVDEWVAMAGLDPLLCEGRRRH